MIVCLCEGCRRKVKVRWKNLHSKHNHQYHRVILGNFFISFHRHFKVPITPKIFFGSLNLLIELGEMKQKVFELGCNPNFL